MMLTVEISLPIAWKPGAVRRSVGGKLYMRCWWLLFGFEFVGTDAKTWHDIGQAGLDWR